jgi:hypothetical protein
VTPSLPFFELARLLRGLVGLDLFTAQVTPGLAAAALLDLVALWFGLEAVLAPRIMEMMRQLPARRQGHPPPLNWRVDAFYVVWFVQATILLTLTCVLSTVLHAPLLFSPHLSKGKSGLVLFMMLWFLAIFYLVLRMAASTLSLGARTSRPTSRLNPIQEGGYPKTR